MSKLLIFVSATIVLFLADSPSYGSPQEHMPPEPAQHNEEVYKKPDENMIISPAKPLNTPVLKTSPRHYNYQQAFTFRLGKSETLRGEGSDGMVVGFHYLFPKFLSPKYEAGADLHQDGRGHILAGIRWIYAERSDFRPSLKLSIDHLADPIKGMATMFLRENWFLRVGGTLEYVIWNPYSLRLESEVVVNLGSQFHVLTLGLSRGW